MTCRRRTFLRLGLAVPLAGAACDRACAEAAGPRVFRILMLLDRGETAVEGGFREFLEERGVAADLVVRSIEGDLRRLPDLVAEAKRLRPDLIYTRGADITLGVVGRYDQVDPRRHVTDIPVVYTMVSSPKGTGIVPSRQSSGRNVTGVDHTVPVSAQISAMRAYRPMQRLAVVYDPAEANSAHNVRQLRELARKADFELVEEGVPAGPDGEPDRTALPALVAAVAGHEPQFLYLGADDFIAAFAADIAATALANRLATFAVTESPVTRDGALLGLVNRERNIGRFTAYKALQILLDGTPPAEIPNNTLARFSFLVNMRTADALRLYPPMDVLGYAELVR